MAEDLTPAKAGDNEGNAGAGAGIRRKSSGGGGGGESKAADAVDGREDVLRELAKACKRQGNFHLACKKFTQVSDLRRPFWDTIIGRFCLMTVAQKYAKLCQDSTASTLYYSYER